MACRSPRVIYAGVLALLALEMHKTDAFLVRPSLKGTRQKSVALRSMQSPWPVIDVTAVPWDGPWGQEVFQEPYGFSGILDQSNEQKVGIIVVDHGSPRPDANLLLNSIVEDYKRMSGFDLVEPAHMELAEPSIAAAFGKCVEAGATFIICHPFFLSRGRHVKDDIPNLMEEAASIFPGVEWAISEPLGCQVQIPHLISRSVNDCLRQLEIKPELRA